MLSTPHWLKRLVPHFNDKHLVELDSLRGLFCMMIFYHHTMGELTHKFVGEIAMGGFFMCSSYLLMKSQLLKKKSKAKSLWARFKKNYGAFLLRRAFRILPSWWLYIAITGLWVGVEFKHFIANFFFYFGFIQFLDNYNFTVIGWSLFVEDCFYILFPVLALFVTSRSRALTILLFGALIQTLWFALARHFEVPNGHDFHYRFPLAHVGFFAMGFLLIYYDPIKTKMKLSAKQESIAIALAVLVTWYSGHALRFIPLGVLIFLLLRQGGRVQSFLSSRWMAPLQWTGTMCLSMYLWHFVFVVELMEVVERGPLKWLVVWTLTLMVSLVTYRLIERPLYLKGRELEKRWFKT